MWLRLAKTVWALRKHDLRVDLRIYSGDPSSYTGDMAAEQGAVRGILQSAIMNSLDMVGIISPGGPELGVFAQNVARTEGLDIFVVPGQEYVTQDGFKVMVYNLQQRLQPGMHVDALLAHVRQNNGFSLVTDLSKRQAQHLNKLSNTESAPDAIEIYNSMSGGYRDIDVDAFPKFVTSAATTASQLQKTRVYTSVPRAELEAMGLIPKGQGVDYEPHYLHPQTPGTATVPSPSTQGAAQVPPVPQENIG